MVSIFYFYFSVNILLRPLWVGRKIVQIGQTEPVGVYPEGVRWYVEWFSLFKTQGNKKEEIRQMPDFYIKLYYLKILKFSYKT